MDITYASPLYSNEGPVYYSDHPSNNTVHPCQPYDVPAESWNEPSEQPGVSLFAQTVLEQDREFHRQFPEAKRAHIEQWCHQPTFQGLYSESQAGFEYYGEGSTLPAVPHRTEPVYAPLVPVLSPPIHAALAPPILHCLHHSYALVSEESSHTLTTTASPPHHAWAEKQFSMETGYTGPEHVNSRYMSPTPLTPPSPVPKIEAHRLVPSNHRQLTRSLSQPAATPVPCCSCGQPCSIGNLSSQTTLKDVIPPSTSAAVSNLISPTAPTITLNNNSIQPTGHWSTDAQAANECLLHAPAPRHAEAPGIIVADQPVVNALSTRHHDLTCRLRKAVRAQSHPYTKGSSPLSSPSRRSSTAPRKAKPKAVDVKASWYGPKKPLLACYFCRGRKIACGAPPEGSANNTCSQCLKRDLECEYPPESHRGLRKKKQDVDVELNAVIMAAAGLTGDSDANAEGEDEF